MISNAHLRIAVIASAACFVAVAAAVTTETWTDSAMSDFKEGTFQNTVVTSRGNIRLSAPVESLVADREDVDFVNDIAVGNDGAIYLATGPEGVVLKYHDDKVSVAYTADQPQVLSIVAGNAGTMYLGTGGDTAQVVQLEPDGRYNVLATLEGVSYVHDLVLTAEGGVLYAATGPEGQIYKITADAEPEVVYDTEQANVLCLAMDVEGHLYAGTDEEGLVFQVRPEADEDNRASVVFDAAEEEISDILFGSDGMIYFASGVAERSSDNAEPTAEDNIGRPDGNAESSDASGDDSDEDAGDSDDQSDDADESPGTAASPVVGQPTLAAAFAQRLAALRQAAEKARGGSSGPATSAEGNAVYRLDNAGFVTELFREKIMFLSMVERDGTLYVGTSSQGRVFAIDPSAQTFSALAKLDAEQVLALAVTDDGQLLAGGANPGLLVRVGEGFADGGTFVSRVFDAGQIARWGRLHVWADVPENTVLTISTRSGNVDDPENGPYSPWSADRPIDMPLQISSPAGRFLQYRLTLGTKASDVTGSVDIVRMYYMQDNRPPVIEALTIEPAAQGNNGSVVAQLLLGDKDDKPKAMPNLAMHTITIKASDPNSDQMIYDVYLRRIGGSVWVPVFADQTQPKIQWDTRFTPDGEYEVKVVAHDSPSNPPSMAMSNSRISDPLYVDNTPPAITIQSCTAVGDDTVRVDAVVDDNLANVAHIAYTMDADQRWTVVLPVDDIADSRSEQVSFDVSGMDAGLHHLTIMAADEKGNIAFVARHIDWPMK